MHGDDLEYFLYTDCKVENLAGEVVEYLKVGSEIIGGNNCKQEMLEIFGQTQIPDKFPPSFLFTPCSSGGWGDKKVLGWDKEREYLYQLLSQARDTQLGQKIFLILN